MVYTIIDIETNGFIAKGVCPEILEVGYLQINRQCEILRGDSFYFYKPEWELNKDASAVHKLSEQELTKHAGEFYGSLVKLYTLVDEGCLIGKNNDAFDIPVIKDFMRREGCGLRPNIYSSLDMQKFYKPIFQMWFQETYKQNTRKSGTLEDLISMCGYTTEQVIKQFTKEFPDCQRSESHGALFDTYMTYLITKYATEKYGLRL